MEKDKLLYWFDGPKKREPGYEKSLDVIQWVERFLKPAGIVTEDRSKANARLVSGGDGRLMRGARDCEEGQIIVGVNRGTVGFLLNPIEDINQIPIKKFDLQLIKLNLIKGTFFPKEGENKTFLAFNDIFCGANIADYISFRINGELSHFPAREVEGNGIIVAPPQGTTGYTLKARGSSAVLPLDTSAWFVSGVATGPYPADQVNPQKITIEVKSRKPVNGYADGYAQEVKDITKVVIEPAKKTILLGFLKGIDFNARRTELAQRVERGGVI